MFLALLPCRSSFQCGVMCLRRLNYDRKELELRRDESQIEVKGKQVESSFFMDVSRNVPTSFQFWVSIKICLIREH